MSWLETLPAIATEAPSVPLGSVLAGALAAAGAVVLVGGALVAAGAARRLRRSLAVLASSAQHMSPGRAGQRFEAPHAPRAARELVRELNALLQRMEDGVHARAQFAGNVAHEFRNPIAAMLADVQLARMSAPDPGEQRELFERQEAELRHLGQLIESFLVMTRIESGEQRRDAVHLDDVVRRARMRCLPAAQDRTVQLELDCPETTTERDPIVTGDAELLQTLVENLVRNAVRHSPQGAAVVIGTRRRDDTVQVFVTDQGPGVPDDIRDEIFKRGVGLRTDEAGFGLGLSIVDSVARLHDGIITLKESAAGGCSFVVALPAARDADAPASALPGPMLTKHPRD